MRTLAIATLGAVGAALSYALHEDVARTAVGALAGGIAGHLLIDAVKTIKHLVAQHRF